LATTTLAFQSFLEWPTSISTNPTCWGGKDGWSFDNKSGYWVCCDCRKPSPASLRLCDICEEIWLPENPTEVRLWRVWYHKECLIEIGEC